MRNRSLMVLLALSSSMLLASSAIAQEESAETAASALSAEAEGKDGARFRGGVAGAFGGIFGSVGQVDYSGFLAGVDGHLGVQINDLIGVYAVPHLAFGSVGLTFGNTDISEGWLAFTGTALVDFTFSDQIFVGAGGGFAAHAATCANCNGLSGPALHFRAGGYPLMGYGEDGIRRKGLMVGGDLRVNFLSPSGGSSITMLQPMVTLGYEAY